MAVNDTTHAYLRMDGAARGDTARQAGGITRRGFLQALGAGLVISVAGGRAIAQTRGGRRGGVWRSGPRQRFGTIIKNHKKHRIILNVWGGGRYKIVQSLGSYANSVSWLTRDGCLAATGKIWVDYGSDPG